MLFVEELFDSMITDLVEHVLESDGTMYQAKIEDRGLNGIPALAYDLFDVLGVNVVFTPDITLNAYNVEEDVIKLKPISWFANEEHFLAIALHELAHWTGHSSRLNRLTAQADVDVQSFYTEEVAAEIAAKYICEFFNVPDTFHTSWTYNYLLQELSEAAMFGANPVMALFDAVDYTIEIINYIDQKWNE